MEIIDRIPYTIDPATAIPRLRFTPERSGFASFDELARIAASLIELRAVYEVSYTGARGEDTVEVAGVVFRSRVLRQNLDGALKVFPFIMTAGPRLEAEAARSGDMLRQYFLEEMANLALGEGAAWLAARLAERWGFSGLGTMDPGSLEDWPVTEQPKLFSIFGDTERLVGVKLTDSMLMIPRKSISGIFFPSDEGFSSCQLCDRPACQGRRQPYDAALAGAYGLNRPRSE